MAKRTEAELRRAKAGAVAAVVEQQRKLGVPLPGGRAVDEFVDPIIAKMAREEVKPPEDASPEIHRPRPDEDGVISQQVGVYDWNLKNDTWTAAPGSYIPNDVDRMHQIVRQLMKLPEWKAQLLKARSVCKRHVFGGPKASCVKCERREQAVTDVLLRAYQRFGNPWKGREKRIVVS